MARGNNLVVSGHARGHHIAGKIDGTPKPGTVVTPKPGTTPDDNGLIEFEPAGASAGLMSADGDRIPIGVLDIDIGRGKTLDDAYADGDHVRVYYPLPGEELNMLFHNESGTADDVVAGTTKMIVDDGTGGLVPTASTPEAEPFLALESITDPSADQHFHCLFTGY